ncbi:putative deoxyribonuclease tatdn3 [Sorochytrium milnesiophthora]
MRITDVHAHLVPRQFPGEQLDAILSTAAAVGVHRVVAVSEHVDDARAVLSLASSSSAPQVLVGVGVHPVQAVAGDAGSGPLVRCAVQADWDALEAVVQGHGDAIACVGEVGLDFSPHVLGSVHNAAVGVASPEDAKDSQRAVFAQAVRFAVQHDVAVNVHSRSAGHHAVAALREHNVPAHRAILHAFDGQAKYAVQAASLGYYLSVPPSIARSGSAMEKMVRSVPLDRLLVETDSPALGPVPGKTNYPANARISLQHIARIKGIAEPECAAIIEENVQRIFGHLRVMRQP